MPILFCLSRPAVLVLVVIADFHVCSRFFSVYQSYFSFKLTAAVTIGSAAWRSIAPVSFWFKLVSCWPLPVAVIEVLAIVVHISLDLAVAVEFAISIIKQHSSHWMTEQLIPLAELLYGWNHFF